MWRICSVGALNAASTRIAPDPSGLEADAVALVAFYIADRPEFLAERLRCSLCRGPIPTQSAGAGPLLLRPLPPARPSLASETASEEEGESELAQEASMNDLVTKIVDCVRDGEVIASYPFSWRGTWAIISAA